MSKDVVKFGNGKYAIRCTNWLGRKTYLDLTSTTYQWTKSSPYFIDCVGTLNEVKIIHGYFIEEVVNI